MLWVALEWSTYKAGVSALFSDRFADCDELLSSVGAFSFKGDGSVVLWSFIDRDEH